MRSCNVGDQLDNYRLYIIAAEGHTVRFFSQGISFLKKYMH